MSMEKEFVPYQEALELKEIEFDEECFGYYDLDGLQIRRHHWYPQNKNSSFPLPHTTNNPKISAPTFSQAFRFFREKYVYDAHVRGTNFRASYVIGIPKEINMESVDGYPLVISWDYIIDETGERKIYEEAELACLRKLIEITKENFKTT